VIKRKILVIPGYKIFPVDSGGAHGQLTFLEKQQHQHDITLLIAPENMAYTDISRFKKRFPGLHLIPLGFDLKKQKGLKAFWNKQVQKFSGKDFTYITRKVKHLNGHVINNPSLIESISAFVNSASFDLIQVEHLRNAGLVSILPANTKKIFIQHEVGFLRVKDDLESLGYNKSYASYISSFTEGAEMDWMQQYNGIITFNINDKRLLEAKGVKVPMQVASPFALFDDELQRVYNHTAVSTLIFIGGQDHFPNEEGLTWFLKNVYPLILGKCPSVSLLVTSTWRDDYKKLYGSLNVKFIGFVENLDEHLKNSVLITPIRIGSGIRVKVFTSMAKGLPVVSTVLGASGIPDLQHGKNIMLADNDRDFASSVIQLLQNTQLRADISKGAFRLASENFASMRFAEERNKFYEDILGSK
jgi:glycosyltransferase involved in cell wall biosynthesis